MTSLFVFVVVIVASAWAQDQEHYCENHYPKRDTAYRLVELVESSSKSLNGDGVYLEEKETLKSTDGMTFYMNSSPPKEGLVGEKVCRYLFDSHHYFRHVVIVAADASDAESKRGSEKHQLHQLAFTCPPKSSCCGLFCCPETTHSVQEAFLNVSRVQDDSDFRRVDAERTVTVNGREYSLKNEKSQHNCHYHLTHHDMLRQRVRADYEPIDYIYFTCPLSSGGCCQLECSKGRNTRHAIIQSTESRQSWFSMWKATHVLMALGLVLAITGFGTGLFVLCRMHNTNIARHVESVRRSRETAMTTAPPTPLSPYSPISQFPLHSPNEVPVKGPHPLDEAVMILEQV